MADGYERCSACGSKFEKDRLQPVEGRPVCALCRWRGAGITSRPLLQVKTVKGTTAQDRLRRR